MAEKEQKPSNEMMLMQVYAEEYAGRAPRCSKEKWKKKKGAGSRGKPASALIFVVTFLTLVTT